MFTTKANPYTNKQIGNARCMTEANPHWTHNEVPGEILRLPNRQVFHGEASIADETVDYTLAFQL